MKYPIPAAVFLLSCLLISPAAGHDCWCGRYGGGGWYCNRYDSGATRQPQGSVAPAAALKVFDGTISEIVYLPGATAGSAMVEARVSTSGRTTLVRLAPVGLLKQSQLALREGDTVSVTGFEVSGMEGDLVVATEIRKGDQRVVLRDPRGQPVW